MVPTLVTYQQLAARGEEAGMRPELVAKVGDLVEQGLKAISIAEEKGGLAGGVVSLAITHGGVVAGLWGRW